MYRATCTLCDQLREKEVREAEERGETNYTPRQKQAEYMEETGRSIFGREREHLDLWSRNEATSFMMKHFIKTHMDREKEEV